MLTTTYTVLLEKKSFYCVRQTKTSPWPFYFPVLFLFHVFFVSFWVQANIAVLFFFFTFLVCRDSWIGIGLTLLFRGNGEVSVMLWTEKVVRITECAMSAVFKELLWITKRNCDRDCEAVKKSWYIKESPLKALHSHWGQWMALEWAAFESSPAVVWIAGQNLQEKNINLKGPYVHPVIIQTLWNGPFGCGISCMHNFQKLANKLFAQ